MGSTDATARRYDLLQFGATGFAGRLTAEYLERHAPEGLRWALAGRSRAKLEQVVAELRELAPQRPAPDVIEVALHDQPAVDAAVAQARLVLTTVGPYVQHGEPLVAAAAKAGTDYVDITGEPTFVDAMYLKYQDAAVASGARLVHCAGFDSVPHDLGAYFTVQQLPADGPISVTGAVRASAEFSGGTFQSAMGIIGDLGTAKRTAGERRAKERAATADDGRRQRPVQRPPHRDPGTGRWLGPLPTIDPAIVLRSAAALPEYGPDFRYEHTMEAKRLATILAVGGGAGALAVGLKLPPARALLKKLKAAGTGPSAERRARSWFRVRFTGEGGGRRVVTEVRGGDPGYDETAKMVAETALCLLLDDVPARAGQLTTAVACGNRLIDRLQAAGMTFEVVEGA